MWVGLGRNSMSESESESKGLEAWGVFEGFEMVRVFEVFEVFEGRGNAHVGIASFDFDSI
jgi:hypothetical protein